MSVLIFFFVGFVFVVGAAYKAVCNAVHAAEYLFLFSLLLFLLLLLLLTGVLIFFQTRFKKRENRTWFWISPVLHIFLRKLV